MLVTAYCIVQLRGLIRKGLLSSRVSPRVIDEMPNNVAWYLVVVVASVALVNVVNTVRLLFVGVNYRENQVASSSYDTRSDELCACAWEWDCSWRELSTWRSWPWWFCRRPLHFWQDDLIGPVNSN